MADYGSADSCPLCGGGADEFFKNSNLLYYRCGACRGIFLSKDSHLSEDEEKKRYLEHNNDVNDPRYRKFAEPVVRYILKNFKPGKHKGLDFGAGAGPVASRMLEEEGFMMPLYDPFFHPEAENLRKKYDFIIASEVIEHFKKPADEFGLLSGILESPGSLVCRTHLYSAGTDFGSWYYKNDPTHVFFYSGETLEYVRKAFGFSKLETEERLVVLSR